MKPAHQNFTIVVNWKKKGFGCAKACSYCNWRDSALLPHGAQSSTDISNFIKQCRKSFITISGGADPLFRFDEHGVELKEMIATIRAHGFKVRVITREVRYVANLKGIADYVSISLDADVLDEIARYRHDWSGMDIEFSLVLPPLPMADIVHLKAQYAALHRQLGARLVLRENLNSIYPLDMARLSFGHAGVVFVPKALCLASRYLSTIDCTGHDIVQDNAGLADYLMWTPEALLFGGFVRHLVNPQVHMEYSDIDVIALSTDVIDVLTERFAFKFECVSPVDAYPRYFIGKSARAGKTIQLVQMRSRADALRFIYAAQFDSDRIGFSSGQFFCDPTVGTDKVLVAIHAKRATTVQGQRDTGLFHPNRPQIEQRHKLKLLRKGFVVTT